IIKQLAVPGPVPLRPRVMKRLQQCPHQPDILEALDHRRSGSPSRVLLPFPQPALVLLHGVTLYGKITPLTNFVPNTIGSSRDTRNIGHGSTDRRTELLVRVIARTKVVVFRGMRAVTLREVFCPGENCPNCKSFTRQAFLAPWPILHLSRQ